MEKPNSTPERTINISITEEAAAMIRRINGSPEARRRFVEDAEKIEPLFDSHVEVEPCFNAADGTSDKRIILKPSKALLEFMTTVSG